MTNREAKVKLATRLDIDYTNIANNGLFSDNDLQDFIQAGVFKAWDYKPWPMTKATKTATTIAADYYDHPEDVMLGSIYLLKVGGKEFDKIDIEDYLAYLENDPTGTDRVWAEYETFIFINRNAYTVGDTYDLYGKKLAPTLSGDNDLLPFSPVTDNSEHSGNDAIVDLAYSEALSSRKINDPDGAQVAKQSGYNTLGLLWKPFAEQRAFNQSKNRPMFDVPDYFADGCSAASVA